MGELYRDIIERRGDEEKPLYCLRCPYLGPDGLCHFKGAAKPDCQSVSVKA